MNIQTKSVFLALMSVFCLSIKAESSSWPYKFFTNSTVCLISSATTITTIHHIALHLNKEPKTSSLFGLISIACGYAAYRSGLSAYTSYKKACASKKALQHSSDNAAPKEKP
ncbi:hypothetical protein H0X06_06970, partial [Candidatus Dependentiae bacterium]|nr:hypothetical protein [Candidatus Dependentiae bacterium]